jgi:hypothetical protein
MEIRTIADIIKFGEEHNMDTRRMEHMGFYIGKLAYTPKSYGIYEDFDTKEIVVYKNKADGSHVEHYRGRDEEKAVGEIMEKLKTAIQYNRDKMERAQAEKSRMSQEETPKLPQEETSKLPQEETPKLPQEENSTQKQNEDADCLKIFGHKVPMIIEVPIVVIFIFIYSCLPYLVVILIISSIVNAINSRPHYGYYTDNAANVYYLQGRNLYYFDEDENEWLKYVGKYDIDDFSYKGEKYRFKHSDDTFYMSDYWNGKYYSYSSGSSSSGKSYDYDNSWDSGWDSGWDDWDSDW